MIIQLHCLVIQFAGMALEAEVFYSAAAEEADLKLLAISLHIGKNKCWQNYRNSHY